MPVGPYSQDVLTRIYDVQWESGPNIATLSLGFSARPTGLYKDGTPTVATLLTEGLPPLSPSTFLVNLRDGATPPIFYDQACYGGFTELTMPDGESGTLTASWSLTQLAGGAAGGLVSYESSTTESGTWEPFLGAKTISITIVMELRPLDFLSISSLDNHYEWSAAATASIPGLLPDEKSMSESGRAESGEILTFTLDVTMDPPSATFTAGLS